MKTQSQPWIEAVRSGSPPPGAEVLEALARIIPEIERFADTPQDPQWHAEGSVRHHVEWVLEEARQTVASGAVSNGAEAAALIIGAALHDLGKVVTTREEVREGKTRIVSPRHTERGRSLAAPYLGGLALSDWERDSILGLIRFHHEPKKLVLRSSGEHLYRRTARGVPLKLVYLLERCDLLGRRSASQGEDLEILELFRSEAEGFGLWDEADPYREWRERLAALAPDEKQNRYVMGAAIDDYENGRILCPEEAAARNWEHRKHHGRVTVLSGPSGSGKSTWMGHHLGDGAEVISLDQIRGEITGRISDQSMNGQAMQIAKERLRKALRAKKEIFWDSTGLRKESRSLVLGLARDYHAATRIVLFPLPPEAAKKRNRQRAHPVPETVQERQYRQWQWPDPWEAWDIETLWQRE